MKPFKNLFGVSLKFTNDRIKYYEKSVRIRSFSGPYFPVFELNTDQKNYKYGHFSRSQSLMKRHTEYCHRVFPSVSKKRSIYENFRKKWTYTEKNLSKHTVGGICFASLFLFVQIRMNEKEGIFFKTLCKKHCY